MNKLTSAFRRFGHNVKQGVLAVVHGSVAVKLSCLFMGIGQIMRKQIVKGILYFLLEVLFVLFMVFFGGKYLAYFFSGNLGTNVGDEIWNDALGVFEYTRGDNSFLILLYGVVSFIVLIVFAVVWGLNIHGNIANDRAVAAGKRVTTFRQDCSALINRKFYLLLLIPPFAGLLVFTVMPLVFMILIAFTNYDFEHMPPGQLFGWVGFETFGKLFGLSSGSGFLLVFLRVLAWTFVWAVFATFTNYFLGMIIALMINKKGIKLKSLWRTLFVIAIAVPQFVTLLLMQKILDGDGILNVILGTNIRWLADTRWASLIPRIAIIVVNMWIGIPYTILMCSGILMNIPAEMYEAGKLDGANPVQLFRKIVLPYMLHATGPYLITQFVGNINNFNVIWLLTGGGPVDNILYGGGSKAQATDLLVTWLYRLTTDVSPQYNVASVIGIIIFVICAVLSLVTYNRSSSAKNEEDYQ
ncbi:MAG: sugar ABC transporter permease [Clostridia bacterium]|nr:sugar ABC transporter permease [Clostridia bacterium]